VDIESFRYKETNGPIASTKPSRTVHKKVRLLGGSFVAAIPLPWIQRAAQLPGKTLNLALAIRYQYGLHKEAPFSLSYKTTHNFGIGRRSVYGALATLESAGLITVQRGTGKSPIITVLVVATGIDENSEIM
jgi:hypothetical protein